MSGVHWFFEVVPLKGPRRRADLGRSWHDKTVHSCCFIDVLGGLLMLDGGGSLWSSAVSDAQSRTGGWRSRVQPQPFTEASVNHPAS